MRNSSIYKSAFVSLAFFSSIVAHADLTSDIKDSDSQLNNGSVLTVESRSSLDANIIKNLPPDEAKALQQVYLYTLHSQENLKFLTRTNESKTDYFATGFDGEFYTSVIGGGNTASGDVKRRFIVGRKDVENLYPTTDAGVVIGPGFYLGRGLSKYSSSLRIKGSSAEFDANGLHYVARLDPLQKGVAKTIEGFDIKNNLVYRFESTKTQEILNGCWVSSEGKEAIYNKGIKTQEKNFKLLSGEPEASSAFPEIQLNDVISVYAKKGDSYREVVFNKTSSNPFSYADLEKLAEKKAAQDDRISVALSQHEERAHGASQVRIMVGIVMLLCSSILALLLGKRFTARRKIR